MPGGRHGCAGQECARGVRTGKPAVMIHCALHAFQSSSEWRDCCGMTSKVHDPFQAFGTEKLDSDHPITKSFPADWKTAGDELYQTIKMREDRKSTRLNSSH